jgi:hypothetical protein
VYVSPNIRYGDNCLEGGNERRQINCDNLPEDIKIDRVVAVNEPVAQPYDLGPGDPGSLGPIFLGNAAGSFSDDLEQPDQRQLQQPVTVQILPGPALC